MTCSGSHRVEKPDLLASLRRASFMGPRLPFRAKVMRKVQASRLLHERRYFMSLELYLILTYINLSELSPAS